MQDSGEDFGFAGTKDMWGKNHTEGVGVHGVSQADTRGCQNHSKVDVQLIETRIGDLSGNGFELGRFNLVGFFLTNTFS